MSNDHVQVQITVDNVGITRQGFGMPIVLSHSAAWAERVRFYSSLPNVGEDFASDSPEYRQANALFSQTPKPPRIAIGRVSANVTQKYVVELGAVGALDETTYGLEVKGEDMADETISFESDEDATEAGILAGLAAALEAKADKTYTATVVGTTVEIVADDPNVWFSLELANVKYLKIKQTHAAPAGLADALDAILLEDGSWYTVLSHFNSTAYALAIAAWVAANERTYVFDVNETDAITVAVGSGTDTGAQMLALGYSATMGCYHPNPAAMFAARWMGRWLPTDPGQATAKFKTLEGVEAVALNGTHKANLRARRMNSYTTEYGRAITWEGSVFSSVYRFLDVRRDVDWLTDELRKAVFGILAGADKVPYTASGIAMVEGAVRGSVSLAVTKGVLAEGTTAVEAPDIADVDAADKSDRVLRNMKFSGTLEGAVHAVIPVRGTVTF